MNLKILNIRLLTLIWVCLVCFTGFSTSAAPIDSSRSSPSKISTENQLVDTELSLRIDQLSSQKGTKELVDLLLERANALLVNGMWREAHLDASRAFKTSDSLSINKSKGDAAKILIEINSSAGNLEGALGYLKPCLNAYFNTKDSALITEALQLWGSIMRETNQLDSATIILDSCIAYAQALKLPLIEAKAHNNLGIVHAIKQDLPSAFSEFTASRKLLKNLSNPDESICENLTNLIYYYYLEAQYDTVFSLSAELIFQSKKLGHSITLAKAYMHLSNAFKATDQYDSALIYSEYFHQLKDSLFNQEIAQRINLSEYQSQIRILEVENKLNASNLANSKLRNSILILLLVLVLSTLATVLFILKKEKKESAKLFQQVQEFIEAKHELKKEEKTEQGLKQELEKELILRLKTWEEELGFLNKNCTLEYVAKACETNSKYISTLVSNYHNKRFPDFINELRIKYILEEIQNDSVKREFTIEALSDLSGYRSSTTFVNAFKKFTGLTPSKYIQSLKKKLEEKSS